MFKHLSKKKKKSGSNLKPEKNKMKQQHYFKLYSWVWVWQHEDRIYNWEVCTVKPVHGLEENSRETKTNPLHLRKLTSLFFCDTPSGCQRYIFCMKALDCYVTLISPVRRKTGIYNSERLVCMTRSVSFSKT